MVMRHLFLGALAVVILMLVIYGTTALLVVGVIVLLCRLARTQAPPALGSADARW
jgi:hypothetical protein